MKLLFVFLPRNDNMYNSLKSDSQTEQWDKTENHLYCHLLVTRRGVWIDNWIYRTLITRNYK
jgi:hypothetical protein